MQHRTGDLDEFFVHENQPYPPSLSEFRKLRFGKKSDLLTCITKPASSAEQLNPPLFWTVRSLMEQRWSMLFHPQLFPHLIDRLKTASSHSFKEAGGHHSRQIVSKIRPERREVMVREEK